MGTRERKTCWNSGHSILVLTRLLTWYHSKVLTAKMTVFLSFFLPCVHIPSASPSPHIHISKMHCPVLLKSIPLVHTLSDPLEETITISSSKRYICSVFSFYENYCIPFFFKGKILFLLIGSDFNKVGCVADFESERENERRDCALHCMLCVCMYTEGLSMLRQELPSGKILK